jgi:cytoskeleton protein RodZ
MTNESAQPVASTAGGMLRAARQAKGLHIAALAAALKVSPTKLEALESDRVSELPDATFARALAQAVCRHLRIESAPVLAQMAAAPTGGLSHVHQGINAPYRERMGGHAPTLQRFIGGPWTWGSLGILVAAAAVMFTPAGLLPSLMPGGAAQPLAADASKPTPTAMSVVGPVESVSATGVATALLASNTVSAAASSALAGSSPSLKLDLPPTASGPSAVGSEDVKAGATAEAVLRTHEATWIEATDASGKTLLARTVPPGEMLSLQGERPLRLKIGNAAGVELLDQGKPVDLKPSTRENVARFELK